MKQPSNIRAAIGWILVALVSGILMFAGAAKVFGVAPAKVVKTLEKANLDDDKILIGCGAMLTGLLLLIPRTSSLGVLLASSYWGGAIVAHMANDEAFIPPAVLLILTWVGASLRNPATYASFDPPRRIIRPADSSGASNIHN